jgi:hypothetical protein
MSLDTSRFSRSLAVDRSTPSSLGNGDRRHLPCAHAGNRSLMAHVAFLFLFLSSCAAPTSPENAARCNDYPDCFRGDGVLTTRLCDTKCVSSIENKDCCECLVDFDCVSIDADRCTENLSEGGSVEVSNGCIEDTARCASQCPGFTVEYQD